MKKALLIILATLYAIQLSGQPSLRYGGIVHKAKQEAILTFLADDLSEGRASGTAGNAMCGNYIADKFREYGLVPYCWNYTQSFRYKDSIILRNIVGVVPARHITDEYLVVSAHYDHLGKLHNVVYNGADDNASGVTALINLAEILSTMRRDGMGPDKNIIFVAFDGKELNMAGSNHFVKNLPFSKRQITCMVNMDILGSVLEPIHKNRKDFMIVLGASSLREEDKGTIVHCNNRIGMNMDIDFTFYGSRDFTKFVYEQGDQQPFIKSGIPALLFTSGFHRYTYKPTDDPDIIDYDILRQRTLLILNIIYRLAR